MFQQTNNLTPTRRLSGLGTRRGSQSSLREQHAAAKNLLLLLILQPIWIILDRLITLYKQFVSFRISSFTTKTEMELLEAIVLDEYSPDGRRKRTPSGMETVEEIQNLTGLLHQNDIEGIEHSTEGTVCTLKWCDFDKETRVAEMVVYGRNGGKHTGQWSFYDDGNWTRFVIPLLRLFEYSYRFNFSEDWQRAEIEIGFLGWYVPRWLMAFDMEQTPESVNGSQWLRTNVIFAFLSRWPILNWDSTPKRAYILETIYCEEEKNGIRGVKTTKYTDDFKTAEKKGMRLTK